MEPTRFPGSRPSITTTHHGAPRTSHTSSSKSSRNTRGISLGGWSIQVTTANIGSSAEMDALSDLLGIPPPEMAFPHNSLVLHHAKSGFCLCFDAVRALRSVDGVKQHNNLEGLDCSGSSKGARKGTKMGEKPKGRGKAKAAGIKVAYADEWGKKRNEAQQEMADAPEQNEAAASTSNFGPDVAMAAASNGIASAKEYDWTYSSTWAGAVGESAPHVLLPEESESEGAGPELAIKRGESWFVPGTDPARDRIPVERLGPSSGEPILFYEDIVLYEDELADNGSSMINVKVRVMPSGFLVLQRFFLRVDDVLFRVFDTRLYCQFTEATGGASVPRCLSGSTAPATRYPGAADGPDLSKLSLGAMQEDAGDDEKWPRVIRECSGCDASYAEVKGCLPPYKPHDLSPLTDPNWVANSLQNIARNRFQQQQASVATGQTAQIPKAQFASSLSHLTSPNASRMTGFLGSRPGERLDLSPARAPGADAEPAKIVGEITDEEEGWQGIGARVDVAVLRS